MSDEIANLSPVYADDEYTYTFGDRIGRVQLGYGRWKGSVESRDSGIAVCAGHDPSENVGDDRGAFIVMGWPRSMKVEGNWIGNWFTFEQLNELVELLTTTRDSLIKETQHV